MLEIIDGYTADIRKCKRRLGGLFGIVATVIEQGKCTLRREGFGRLKSLLDKLGADGSACQD